MNDKEKIDKVIRLIIENSWIEGEHHKAWSDNYSKIREELDSEEYYYDEGIPP